MTAPDGRPSRLAAVVIPIFADAPHDVIFIERAHHMRRHAGEIAFPGGATDEADDGDLRVTALREMHEEIGIPPERIEIVGRLSPVLQRSKTFAVTPFVGIVDAGTPIVLEENEVAAIHRVPLARIIAPNALKLESHIAGASGRIDTWIFRDGSLFVWGLTGKILAVLLARVDRNAPDLRGVLEPTSLPTSPVPE